LSIPGTYEVEEYVLSFFFVNPFAVSSSPVDVAQIKYGMAIEKETNSTIWSWSNISSPIFRCSDRVCSIYYQILLSQKHVILFRSVSLDFGCRLDLCCPLSSVV